MWNTISIQEQKQEDFVLKQIEVLIDAPEKAKKLCHILSSHKGTLILQKADILWMENLLSASAQWICQSH